MVISILQLQRVCVELSYMCSPHIGAVSERLESSLGKIQ